jgi:hypothetical protein
VLRAATRARPGGHASGGDAAVCANGQTGI